MASSIEIFCSGTKDMVPASFFRVTAAYNPRKGVIGSTG